MALLAGYGEVDITPGLGVALDGYAARDRAADEISDPLFAQALYLSDGASEALIISLDVCSMFEQAIEAVRASVADATGTAPEAIIVAPSHTHFAPMVHAKPWMREEAMQHFDPGFKARLVEASAQAAAAAKQAAGEVRLRVGCAQAPGISFNRRPLSPDGKCANRMRLPPEQAAVASAVGAELRSLWLDGAHGGPRYSPPQDAVEGLRLGVTDPEVTVLCVEAPDGQPLAALVNFACHPACGGPNFYAVSADYIGPMRRLLAEALAQAAAWPGSPADARRPAVMFVLGAAGDQVPTWREGNSRVRVGQGLAGAAALAWHCAEPIDAAELRVATAQTDLPLRQFPPVEQLREQYDQAKARGEDYLRVGIMMAMAELVGGRAAAPVTLTALRIGPWALVNGVGEIVAEIGLHIKQRSPVPYTMFVSLSASHYGYMTTDESMREGGYEADTSGLGFGSAAAQISGALEALAQTV